MRKIFYNTTLVWHGESKVLSIPYQHFPYAISEQIPDSILIKIEIPNEETINVSNGYINFQSSCTRKIKKQLCASKF